MEGIGNHVEIGEKRAGTSGGDMQIYVKGDGNRIVVGDGFCFSGEIRIDILANNASIVIGENSAMNKSHIFMFEDNSTIEIGSDTIISCDTNIWETDAHAIFDENDCLINEGKSVKIGDHVWIGMGVKVGKNTQIPDGCIVGWGSVVTKRFTEPNCIIAGVPARVVKTKCRWDIRPPSQILKEEQAQSAR